MPQSALSHNLIFITLQLNTLLQYLLPGVMDIKRIPQGRFD